MKTTSAAAYRPRITIVEPDAGVVRVLSKYKRFIRGKARSITSEDPQFWEDVVQEGEIELWEAQHWRLDLEDPQQERYLLKRIIRRMRNAHGILHRQAYPKIVLNVPTERGMPGISRRRPSGWTTRWRLSQRRNEATSWRWMSRTGAMSPRTYARTRPGHERAGPPSSAHRPVAIL